MYNLYYCSFRRDKEGRRKSQQKRRQRKRERNVAERRNRETARFDCYSLRKPVPLSSFIVFAATSPLPLRAYAQKRFLVGVSLWLSVVTTSLEVRPSAALKSARRLSALFRIELLIYNFLALPFQLSRLLSRRSFFRCRGRKREKISLSLSLSRRKETDAASI